MPLTAVFCIIGAMSISAFPLFSGFVTKSLIISAVGYEHILWAFLGLTFASAGVMEHSGIKIPFFAFFAHDSGIRCKEAPVNMLLAMGGMAALCIGIGVYPAPLYALLPYEVDYQPYTATHVFTQLQLLMWAVLAFAVLMRTGLYPAEMRSTNLDFDWTYRRALPRLLGAVQRTGSAVWAGLVGSIAAGVRALVAQAYGSCGPRGLWGRTWSTGATVLWVAILLAAYLVVYYLR